MLGEKLSLKEKICYGLGDFGCNIVFATITTWFIPYAISCGVSLQEAGLIIFVSKFIDAICDVVLGIYIDRFPKKIRKLMSIGVPLTVASLVALFCTMLLPESTRLIWLFVFFNLTNSIFYNFVNIPYSSIGTRISTVENERFSLSCFRMTGSILCMVIINMIYPLVEDKFILYLCCSVIFSACIFSTVIFTKDRVIDNIKENNKIFDGVLTVIKHGQFYISLSVFMVVNVILTATLMRFGIEDPDSAGIKTLCFMCPSIVILPFLPKIETLKDSLLKYLLLCVGFAIISIITYCSKLQLNLFACLMMGIAFSPLASMVYNVFVDTNMYIMKITGKNISGLLFAVAAIVGNLSVGFLSLLIGKGLPIDIVTLVAASVGTISTLALMFLINHYDKLI